jgi:hypothetical protein
LERSILIPTGTGMYIQTHVFQRNKIYNKNIKQTKPSFPVTVRVTIPCQFLSTSTAHHISSHLPYHPGKFTHVTRRSL